VRLCNGGATEKSSEGLKIEALRSEDCPNIRHVTKITFSCDWHGSNERGILQFAKAEWVDQGCHRRSIYAGTLRNRTACCSRYQ
jgi:hypothetical protein